MPTFRICFYRVMEEFYSFSYLIFNYFTPMMPKSAVFRTADTKLGRVLDCHTHHCSAQPHPNARYGSLRRVRRFNQPHIEDEAL